MLTQYLKTPLLVALAILPGASMVRADYPSEVLASGPLLYHRLDENVVPLFDGATNSGSLGVSGDGIYEAGVIHPVAGAIVSQPGNSAASFAINSKVSVPFQSDLNISTPFSVELWVKPTDTGATRCVASSIKVGNSGWLFYNSLTAGAWTFRTLNASLANVNVTGGTVTVGAWHHLVGVWDGTTTRLYVNGVQVATGAAPTFNPVIDTTVPLTIGGRSDNSFLFNGSVDETAYYTNVLSSGQVLAHYQAGTNAAPSTPYNSVVLGDGAVGYWRLSEAVPARVTAANTGTYGSSGNGTYFDGTTSVAGPRPSDSLPGFSSGNNAPGFNGVNGFVRIPQGTNNLSGGSLANVTEATFLCWVKRNGAQADYKGLVAMRPTSTGLYLNTDDTLNYSWNDAGNTYGFNSALIPPDNEWTMAAVVVRPTSAMFYMGSVSGGFVTASNGVAHPPANFTSGPFAVGRDINYAGAGRFFNGAIDEAAVYTKALNGSFLQSLFFTAIGSNAAPFMVSDPPVLNPEGTIYSTTTFSLASDVAGALPLTYQWRTNGVAIPGATSATYTRVGATTNDTGIYDVVVTNAYGGVTSMVVSVTVNPAVPPTITQQPVSRFAYAGGTGSFTVAATGTSPFTYQWKHAGTNLPGATNSTLIVTGVDATKTGNYSVNVANVAGNVDSATVTLSLRTPSAGSYEAALVGDGPVAYWRLGETSGNTAFDMVGGHDGVYSANVAHTSPGALNGDADGGAGFNGADTFVSTGTPLMNGFTKFTLAGWVRRAGAQANRTGLFGQNDNVEFGYISDQDIQCYDSTGVDAANPLADGVWGFVVVTSDGTNRTIYVNAQALATGTARATGVTNSFLFNIGGGGIFDNPNANGNWFSGDLDEVALFDKALTPDQINTLYLIGTYGTSTPPLVTLNPASTTAAVGTTVAIKGGIAGSLPITYQWKKNGANIPGATSQTLTLNNVFFTDAANYVLYGTNSIGFTNTTAAALTVLPQPTYANQTNALVLHLRFDGNYLDTSGRTNDASAPAGSPGFVTGKLGQGVNINTAPGANYLTVSDVNSDLQFDAPDSFTVAYWLNYTAAFNDVPVIGNAVNSTYQFGWVLTEDGGRFEWTAVSGASAIADPVSNTSPLINNGAWHHVAVAFDRTAGTAASYVDGARVATHSLTGVGTLITLQPVTIGQDPTGGYGNANFNLDDVGIWRRALSDYEVLSIYNAAQNSASFDTYGPVKLDIRAVGSSLYVSWQSGTLLESTNVTGPYAPVSGASAPYYVTTPSVAKKFYRVQQ